MAPDSLTTIRARKCTKSLRHLFVRVRHFVFSWFGDTWCNRTTRQEASLVEVVQTHHHSPFDTARCPISFFLFLYRDNRDFFYEKKCSERLWTLDFGKYTCEAYITRSKNLDALRTPKMEEALHDDLIIVPRSSILVDWSKYDNVWRRNLVEKHIWLALSQMFLLI